MIGALYVGRLKPSVLHISASSSSSSSAAAAAAAVHKLRVPAFSTQAPNVFSAIIGVHVHGAQSDG